ncbi:uncharacterized protein LOC123523681 [Mercenaria mercenaria]|uniref:uncharacterized protein LOC123523681 n=1 Tax=Mercenaria mercenaria TaxID=6596 RepID=UPI001E1DFF3D|nr:uncharacterized protein LOC123523681 [Mercenaria mercenaria]
MAKQAYLLCLAVVLVITNLAECGRRVTTKKLLAELQRINETLCEKLNDANENIRALREKKIDFPTCPVPCQPGCQTGEMCINLDQTGAIVGSLAGVDVFSEMTPLMDGKPCSRQIVLKVHFRKDLPLQEPEEKDLPLREKEKIAPMLKEDLTLKEKVSTLQEDCPDEKSLTKLPLQRMLKVQMYLSNGERSGTMFNIGDSRTNNGFAGDSGTQTFDAEIQGLSQTTKNIHVYGHDNCNSALLYNHIGALDYPVSVVNFWIKNQYLKVSNDYDGLIQSTCDSCLFALQGQTDAEGPENEDIYIGANRVVLGGNNRTGVGLCYMKLRWVNGPFQ